MSIRRAALAIFTTVVLLASSVFAQGKSTAPISEGRESFADVSKQLRDIQRERIAELGAAFKKNDQKAAVFSKPSPLPPFSPRFLAIAERDPGGPEAIDALKMTLHTSADPMTGSVLPTRAKAVGILRKYYVTKPAIKAFIRDLAQNDDDDSRALIGDVIAHNPDRQIQVAAYKEEIALLEGRSRFVNVVKDPKRLAAIEKAQGKTYVRNQLDAAEKARLELGRLAKTLREKYSDLVADLSIGNAAPEVKIQTIDGKEATLSALKGNVVVLDIWATWCGPCKKMIPHEREMVERLKNKPFVLVSISTDEKKETLTAFLAKEKMPWTHWWNGNEGGIIDKWDVSAYPTIYVLDSRGVIRHTNLRGEALEKAVNALLTELTGKKTVSN
jgi:thiol-disulfide isomerase/thioredoxin